jgi:hypothetical protein
VPTTYLPQPLSSFVSGPAKRMLARLPASVRELLEMLQYGLKSDLSLKDGLVWIAGGAVRAIATDKNEAIRDVDLWFPTHALHLDALELIVNEYDHRTCVTSPMCTKLEVDIGQDDWTKVDLVRRMFPSPLDTARGMDFICCSAALSTTVYARHERFEQDASAKVLALNASWRPRASLKRVEKFVERGWTITDDELAKLKKMAEDTKLPEYDMNDDKDKVYDYE